MKRVYKIRMIIVIIGFLVVAGAGIGIGVAFLKDDDTKGQQPSTGLSLSELKDKLESFSTDPIEHDSEIEAIDWTNITDSFFTDLIKQPTFSIPSTFDAQYKISNPLTSDGNLTIELRIRKQGEEWTILNNYEVLVNGINIGKVKTYLESTLGKKILERDSSGVFNVARHDLRFVGSNYFEGYQNYPPGVGYAQVSGGDFSIDHDGIITVQFRFDLDKQYYLTMEFKVGKDTWDAKEILENLGYDEIVNENGISATNDWTNIDEFFTTIGKEKPTNLPSNSDIQYQIVNSASPGEDLVVDFRYRRKDIVNDKWTTITSQYVVPIKEIDELDATKSILENLVSLDEQVYSEDINKVPDWTPITDDVYTNILKVEVPSISSNIEVQYQIPYDILHDGDYEIFLRFKRKTDDDTNWQTIIKNIHLVGLDLERAKAYIDGLRKKTAEYYFNNLNGPLSQFTRPMNLTTENAALIFEFDEGERYIDPPQIPIQLIITRDITNEPPQYVILTFRFATLNGPPTDPVEIAYTLYL